jgi:hypothetical protein
LEWKRICLVCSQMTAVLRSLNKCRLLFCIKCFYFLSEDRFNNNNCNRWRRLTFSRLTLKSFECNTYLDRNLFDEETKSKCNKYQINWKDFLIINYNFLIDGKWNQIEADLIENIKHLKIVQRKLLMWSLIVWSFGLHVKISRLQNHF